MNREAKRYSDDELRQIVAQVRKWFGVDDLEMVDVVACLKRGQVWTVAGVKRLILEIVADCELIGADAITTSGEERVSVRVKASVFNAAESGVRRARMTLSHELAHVVLDHRHPALARLTGVDASIVRSSLVGRFESSANRFASLFLVKPELAERCGSADEISEKFGVSLPAAEICFEKINRKWSKPKIAAGFVALLDNLSCGTSSAAPANANDRAASLVGRLCVRCKSGALIPKGSKYHCEDCGFFGELPDGDSYGT